MTPALEHAGMTAPKDASAKNFLLRGPRLRTSAEGTRRPQVPRPRDRYASLMVSCESLRVLRAKLVADNGTRTQGVLCSKDSILQCAPTQEFAVLQVINQKGIVLCEECLRKKD